MTTTLTTREQKPTLKQAQELVGGDVEIVTSRVDNGMQILVDEEGLIKKLPFNEKASVAAGIPLYGNAVFLTGEARW